MRKEEGEKIFIICYRIEAMNKVRSTIASYLIHLKFVPKLCRAYHSLGDFPLK